MIFSLLRFSLAILVGSFYLWSCSPEKQEDVSPNIVVIIADDLGWMDVGYNGQTYYETPNIDQLASEGMIFDRFYPSAANCAPSRACIMTGLCLN